ncbi:LysR family transcriptional regulator [Anoxybacterium hadale]|uniref:LysR family transcriptional regulator n=1 Tax=Anoxybacterium hadale TaxID=3408580 RepID=A0ACD1AH72_9FIRM|nr:LysR family transcriptional regulator [Clostridiales bacterium]
MELRQLNTFVTVTKLNNFTKAAAYLGYSQASVTSQIQLLEKELGVYLFDRIGKRIFLTPEGEKLLTYSKEILKLYDETKESFSSNELKGTIMIGASDSLCALRLPLLLKEFHERYPAVEIVLKMKNYNDAQTALRENEIDVAFVIGQKIGSPEFISDLEFPEPLALLTIPGHPLSLKNHISPEDIVPYNAILAQKGCSFRKAFEKCLDDAKLFPKYMMEVGSIQAIKQLTISGMGISLLPRIAVEDELNRKLLAELDWAGAPFDLVTQIIYHRNKRVSPMLQAFLDLAKETMKPL